MFLPALLLLSALSSGLARRSADLYCEACRALVDEMESEISRVDPLKMVESGTFRLTPDGIPVTAQVPYGRSEPHLLSLLSGVCEQMLFYVEAIHPVTHRLTYRRLEEPGGAAPNTTPSPTDPSSSLKMACEKLAEEYEDEFIEFFSRETENVKDRLCSRRTDLCDHALSLNHDEL